MFLRARSVSLRRKCTEAWLPPRGPLLPRTILNPGQSSYCEIGEATATEHFSKVYKSAEKHHPDYAHLQQWRWGGSEKMASLNYRPLSLSNAVAQLYASVVASRHGPWARVSNPNRIYGAWRVLWVQLFGPVCAGCRFMGE